MMAVSRSPMESLPTAWVARFPAAQGNVIALFRGEPGLMVLGDEVHLWIRPASSNVPLSDELLRRLRLIAVAELLYFNRDGLVVPWGKRVPTGHAPTGTWFPIEEFITPQAPVARYAAQRPEPATLSFRRSEDIIPPTALRISLTVWTNYVVTAPNLRLARWEFAVNTAGEVLVRGTPLPPLSGQHYWETDGLLVPSGWMWSPTVSADIVRRVLRLEVNDFALADCVNSTWEVIPREAFVPARRQNVRRTGTERAMLSGGES